MQQVEQTLFCGTLLFLFGCHLGLNMLIPLWVAALAVISALLFVVLCCYRHTMEKTTMAAVLTLFLACGAVCGSGAMRHPLLEISNFVGEQVRIYGNIEAGSVKTNAQGVSFILDCTAVKQEKEAVSCAGKVRMFIKDKIAMDKLYGRVAVQGTLKPLTDFANPGSWDGALWNELHGLQGRVTISGNTLYLSGGDKSIADRIADASAYLRGKLQEALPGQTGAVLAGMTLGGYDGISEELRTAFVNVGLAHLLAVSGTHVALLAGFLLLVLRKRTNCTLFIAGGILFIYAALCGFKPPIMRALLMSLAFFVAGSNGRVALRSNIFCGVLLLLLCYEPRWLWNVGFQISFATTAGLLFIYPAISGYCVKFLPTSIGATLAVSLTAQLAALPFLVHYFHQLSLIGIAVNLLLVPLLEIAVLLVLAGFVLLPVFGVGQLLFIVAGILLNPLLEIIQWFSSWSLATITVGSWPLLCSAVYYFLLWLLFNNSIDDDFSVQERKILVIVCCSALIFVGAYEKLRPQPLTVHFIDVGQGDAALVITPQGKTLLVDTGGLRGDYDIGNRIIVPYLRYLSIRSLDILLLSHGHHDHAGGAAAVAKAAPIKKVILPQEEPSSDVQALFKNTEAQISYAKQGENYYLGNTLLQIISAPASPGNEDFNENSLIVRVADKTGSIIFTGDATEEEELLATANIVPGQVLKVSHHGSNNSSCMSFLTAVNPQIAVISVGADNSYGHPGSETLQRLAACNAQVWRTDLAGAIKITFDDSLVKCYSYRYQKEFF